MAIEDTNINNQDHSNKVLNNRLDDFIIIFVCQRISSISSPNTYRYIEKNHVYLKHAGILHNNNVLLMTIDNPREKVALRISFPRFKWARTNALDHSYLCIVL